MSSRLVQRQSDPPVSPDQGDGAGNNGQGNQAPASGSGVNPTIIIIAVVVIVVVVAVCLYLVLRIYRSRNADPRYLPKPLKKLWVKWDVSAHHSNTKYSRTGDADDDGFNRRMRMRHTQDNLEEALQDVNAQRAMAAASMAAQGQDGVNRNTSVRSVMTLPPYRPNPNETEQVLGREGERAGIDTVVELPTAEDEEALREEEMNALYQIRLARRRQIAEREERREERRLARERQDHRALAEIRERARIASEQAHREVDELRESHDAIKQHRTRAVSSVSYADVGLVRADGTRLRANSNESERMGLLSDAGSIALSNREESRSSIQHRRAPSSQSVLSIDTVGSHNATGSRSGSPGHVTGHSRASSRGQLSESYSMATVPRTGSAMSQRAGSSPELIDAAEADIGDSDMPLHSPPGYDDVSLEEIPPATSHSSQSRRGSHQSGGASPYNEPPPEYESPTQKRQKRLSAQMADLAAEQQHHLSAPPEAQAGPSHTRTTSRGVGGVPQLPSLRLNRLPQIVIEPSSAITPARDHIDEEP
ncbi:hypothetical protein N0V82_002636 [Gnomoniopsis sp. IMI 355080]|nr:hypothetical protein N0V82_002636 [Gnomoniopsis sp. IMI 355080]